MIVPIEGVFHRRTSVNGRRHCGAFDGRDGQAIPADKREDENDYMRVLSLYMAPLFLLSVSTFFVVLTFTAPVPRATDLSEVRGHLASYHIYSSSGGRYPKTIVVLEEGHRFWTAALDRGGAGKVLTKRGAEVKTYVLPHSTKVPIDGAVKSYGLWVNGRQVESLESELAGETLVLRLGLPALAIFLLALAVYIHLKSRGKYAG